MEHFDWLLGFWYPNINFVIFVGLAIYFFRGPLGNMAKSRREEFLTALKAANEAKDAAEAKLKELDARLATIDRETAEIRHNAEREAERESARIIESANRLAQHLRDEARRVADAEIARAKQELRIAILKDVRQEVEKKIGQEFGEAQHNAYSAARAGAMQTLTGRQ